MIFFFLVINASIPLILFESGDALHRRMAFLYIEKWMRGRPKGPD